MDLRYAGCKRSRGLIHFAPQQVGGDLRVQSRGLQLLVSEPHLDDADINLLLKQMRGKAMAQRVHGDALIDARRLSRRVDGTIELARAQCIKRVQSRE